MGRPRKRRHEETGDTQAWNVSLRAQAGRAVGAADAGVLDPSRTNPRHEPKSRTEGSRSTGDSFEGHEMFLFGGEYESNLPVVEASDFGIPGGPESILEHDLSHWVPSQDLSQPLSTIDNIPLQLQTPPDAPDELDSNGHTASNAVAGCSCFFDLYSMHAKFQSLPEPSFPFSMSALRSAATLSRSVVACHNCSQTYNTALQNSMLLGTLLQLLIMEYAKLLKHIDTRSKEAEKLVYRFGDVSTQFDTRHTGFPDCPMAINIDLSGDEWRTLARKAVSQEVLGNSQSTGGIVGLVQAMGDRQTMWRERFSKGHCISLHTADHQSGESHNHQCVFTVYTDNLKRSLEALGL